MEDLKISANSSFFGNKHNKIKTQQEADAANENKIEMKVSPKNSKKGK